MGQGAFLFDQLGQSKIRQVRLTPRIQQDVAGLEIAMQHPALVGVVNSAGNGGEELCGFFRSVAADVRRLN